MSKKRKQQHLSKSRRSIRRQNPDGGWTELHPDGSKTVQLGPETAEMMRAQHARFVEKFGREPRPNDPLFFDPDEDEPVPMSLEKLRRGFLDAAVKAGLDLERGIATWDAIERGEYPYSPV